MLQEGPNTPSAEFPLKKWYSDMPEDDRIIIEADVFNTVGVPDLDLVCEEIRDQEVARSIMSLLREYVSMKRAKAERAQLKEKIQDIIAFVDRQVFPE